MGGFFQDSDIDGNATKTSTSKTHQERKKEEKKTGRKQNKTKQNKTKKNIGGSSNRGCAKESERGMDGVEAEDQKGS
jgi:hypothetical protein